ncbi:transcription factor PAP1-domain-containing protein [Truncatella angustata]|uniref:Transcription factor PAP1-domain-containing protein n=1 Tax=Truncatella angustata TaxID=152316 RepID=A0A9P8UDI0_9PEZI|nr:transcription factor PAP1-domain-containing protein [Truncatella angustata]KAH6647634.1 transcription factor PAP1-domain-containing protein [Truncatella angustata]KAH8204335.1 hypothetical protein TruAng_001498 [Truncatella angustata]
MASAQHPNGLPPHFILTPQQQALLFRALTSNQPANESPQTNSLSLSPAALHKSPPQNNTNGSGVQDSPFLDYDYSFGPDSSGFDFDLGLDNTDSMIGDLPGTSLNNDKSSNSSDKGSSPDNDIHDKRSHPDDDDDDDKEGSAKRRESEGKVPKKPGRKPLTNEPSSKRKAQNRAAQRAFRERKEQHLKDLETKVQELEKVSEQTNNENSQLRAKVEKMNMELSEYKKRLTVVNNNMRSAPTGSSRPVFGQNLVNNLNDVNFMFEFPKFGVLPGPQQSPGNTNTRPSSFPSPSNSFSTQPTPSDKVTDKATPGSTKSRNSSEPDKEALAKVSSIISSGPSYDAFFSNASRSSLDSGNYSIGGGNSGSPSSSSNSNAGGPSSSCGTSPEPFTQSPMGFKPVDTLTTIGEEQPQNANANATHNQFDFGNFDNNNFDWLSQQNGGQFDPQLFGGYREPQDNILANATFDDTFFNDAFDADFTTPFNVAPTSPKAPKKNICAEIDARKEEEDTIVATVNGKLLTCNNIWERLQNCPKVQSGDIDLDGLCSDLQKKAKCGGTGAVVDEKDFKAVMSKHLGPCPDDKPQ